MRRAHDGLERRVEDRTAELARANDALREEVAQHRRTGGALRDSEARLRAVVNTAVRYLRDNYAQPIEVRNVADQVHLSERHVSRLFLREIEWPYQNILSLLNLCAVALLLCTYTGRFVYPLLSLEGTKFWILRLLPLERSHSTGTSVSRLKRFSVSWTCRSRRPPSPRG